MQKLFESKMPLNINLSQFTYNGISKLKELQGNMNSYYKDYQSLNQSLGRWITADTNLMYVFVSYVKYHSYRAKYSYTQNNEKVKEYITYMYDTKFRSFGFDIMPSKDENFNIHEIKSALEETRKAIGGYEAIVQFSDLDNYIKQNANVKLNTEDVVLKNNFPSAFINFIYGVILSSPLTDNVYLQFIKTIAEADVKNRAWGLVNTCTMVTNPTIGSYYKLIDGISTDKEKFNNLTSKITEFNSKVLQINTNMPSGFYTNGYESNTKFTTSLHTLIGTYQLLNVLLKEKYVIHGGNEADIEAINVSLPVGFSISKQQISSDAAIKSAKQDTTKLAYTQRPKSVKTSLRGIVGGDMGTTDLVESRNKTQEIANMQVSLSLALLLTSRKSVKEILLGEIDDRILKEVEKLSTIRLSELSKGKKIEIESKLNDGIFGFRTRKMVLVFKKFVNKSFIFPMDMKIKTESEPIVNEETKKAITYVLDKYLYVAAEEARKPITVKEALPKEEKYGVKPEKDINDIVKKYGTVDDLSKKIEKDITGLENE